MFIVTSILVAIAVITFTIGIRASCAGDEGKAISSILLAIICLLVALSLPRYVANETTITVSETAEQPDFQVKDLGWREIIGQGSEYEPTIGLWYYKVANNPGLPTDNSYNQKIVWVNMAPSTAMVDGGFVRNIKDGKEYIYVVDVEKRYAPSYLGLVTWFVRLNNKPPRQ